MRGEEERMKKNTNKKKVFLLSDIFFDFEKLKIKLKKIKNLTENKEQTTNARTVLTDEVAVGRAGVVLFAQELGVLISVCVTCVMTCGCGMICDV